MNEAEKTSEKSESCKSQNKGNGISMAIWIVIGIGIGAAFGILAYGAAIGIVLGFAFSLVQRRRRS
jgi:F0F1-type ATP synthase assembly protein I